MNSTCVKIIGFSDIDEKLCAAAGRISTQEGTALSIWDKSQDREKNANLISKVTQSGHNSTVEHAFFNLAFNDVSVVTEQFMIEFRLASFTVKSRRYVDFSDAGYIVPELENSHREKYIALMDSLFAFYGKMESSGIPKEDARFVLPYCFKSNFFCSLNGRELIHVLEAMIFGRGKNNPEIYSLGISLLEQSRKLAPGIFTDFEKRHENYSDSISFDFKSSSCPSDEYAQLIDYSKNGERTIALSALLQYGNYTKEETDEILSSKENIESIISKVIKSNRPRALENANYTFRLNNVSLACITHFARHRIQSVNLPPLSLSDRGSYIVPKSVMDAGFDKEYRKCFENTKKLYNEFKNDGIDESTLTYILLAGNTLDFTITMNARELLLFLSLRSCTRAQWEIQIYANKMLELLREVSPSLFKFYGPSCFVKGKCPEGRFSCGKITEIKNKYQM